MRKQFGSLIFSPTDLIRYLASPYASWMDRFYLEYPDAISPDDDTADQALIAKTGIEHEQTVLAELKSAASGLVEILTVDFAEAHRKTLAAIKAKAPIVYQAALQHEQFAGFADFMILDGAGQYQVWDTKLARSPKPYYAIQLCCYSEMYAKATGNEMPDRVGIILGSKERVELRVEDYIHYYGCVRTGFLALQGDFTGKLADCPEPMPRADHGRWTSHAERYFEDNDHLVRVAGISVGQIKKLKAAGVETLAALSAASGLTVAKLASGTLEKLVAQARLQTETLADRGKDPEAPPRFEVIPDSQDNPMGLAALPPADPSDVFFDMEGYPLAPGGLEYLFGAVFKGSEGGRLEYRDWWAHDRAAEKRAFEGFVDWVFALWRRHPTLHIYHYAAYEVSALRRLSTHHNSRQDEVDELLRHEVFVDLYQIIRHGLRVGESSYSIKAIERLYRPKRSTEVSSGAESIVHYAAWIGSGQPGSWKESTLLKGIRDYNEDDCRSTAELVAWLRHLIRERGVPISASNQALPYAPKEPRPEVIEQQALARQLQNRGDPVSLALADLVEFHRREEKPLWWRMFDRAKATAQELREDAACIEGVTAIGRPTGEAQSLVQRYRFDPAQECKLTPGDRCRVMFPHDLETKFTLVELDVAAGGLALKIGRNTLDQRCDGRFPASGSLLPYEYLSSETIQAALAEIGRTQLSDQLCEPVAALLQRTSPVRRLQDAGESTSEAAVRVTSSMLGQCLVVQGPPGTGKTFTAAHVIQRLLSDGKRVGVASNSHKAIINLLEACGKTVKRDGGVLHGLKVGGDSEGALFKENPQLRHIAQGTKAFRTYSGGIVGGTAWLFTLPEWEGQLDVLFIDEAGQVSLANTIAMARSASNVVLLGDQMQLEQPIQGSHPGDSGLSGLQYALKDVTASKPDLPVFHAVVPADYGLFLAESRRMHPAVCRFISESVYESRLTSHADCARQRIAVPPGTAGHITKEFGIVFNGVEHDGNVQQSDEEVERVVAIYNELLGRPYTASDGTTRRLALGDFLFVAPYNAQVRALQSQLPSGAFVGSVDKFQGQEAPVCILSLCSSFGEYGSRGLGFILDRNRLNVAISRAQCLAVVVADPRIATTPVNSLADMSLVNLFCKLAAQ